MAATTINDTVPRYLRTRPLRAARRRCRRWPTRWTSAIRATSSACAGCSTDDRRRDARDDHAVGPHRRRRATRRFARCSSAYGYVCDPHTAIAYRRARRRWRTTTYPTAFLATAHPAKFRDIVEPLIRAHIPAAARAGASALARAAARRSIAIRAPTCWLGAKRHSALNHLMTRSAAGSYRRNAAVTATSPSFGRAAQPAARGRSVRRRGRSRTPGRRRRS